MLPGFNPSSTLYLCTYDWLEQDTKSALFIKYGDLIAFLPNLKWDTVIPPDFLES